DVTVELVDAAERFDAGIVLGDTAPVAQPRLAGIAGAGVDPAQPMAHGAASCNDVADHCSNALQCGGHDAGDRTVARIVEDCGTTTARAGGGCGLFPPPGEAPARPK